MIVSNAADCFIVVGNKIAVNIVVSISDRSFTGNCYHQGQIEMIIGNAADGFIVVADQIAIYIVAIQA